MTTFGTSDSYQMVGLIPFSSFFFLMEGLVSIGEQIKIKTKVKKNSNSTQPFTV